MRNVHIILLFLRLKGSVNLASQQLLSMPMFIMNNFTRYALTTLLQVPHHIHHLIVQEIEERKHRVLLTSPEMCLEHPKFSKLMRMPEFTQGILAFVVDEAHCISQWGDLFRKKYADLEKLWSFIPDYIPILATSATIPLHILNDIRLKLCLSEAHTFTVNLGNDRPNITPIVCRMHGAANDLDALNFAIDEARDPGTNSFTRTIIFFNTHDLAYKGYKHLRGLVFAETRAQIDFLHAGRTRLAKRKVMNNFKDGKLDILCATEIAGMVCNSFMI